MTQQRRAARVATFLILMMGLLSVFGGAAALAPAALTVSTSSATQALVPTDTEKPGQPFGGDLFTPAPTLKCQIGACWGDGTPCGANDEGVCSQPKGTSCGICNETSPS